MSRELSKEQISEIFRSIEIKDCILIKGGEVDPYVAAEISTMLQKPVIILTDINNITSADDAELERIQASISEILSWKKQKLTQPKIIMPEPVQPTQNNDAEIKLAPAESVQPKDKKRWLARFLRIK